MQRTGHRHWTRRQFLAAARRQRPPLRERRRPAGAAEGDRALVAITLDLEMSRNFPGLDRHALGLSRKGNLNDETKRYTVEACRRVKAAGGVLHCFAVGRVFEQESVDWLKEIVAGRPSRRQPHLRPRQRAGDAAGGRPVPLPAGALADRGPDSGRRHPRQHPPRRPRRCKRGSASRRPAFALPAASRTGCAAGPTCGRCSAQQGFGWVSSLYPRHPNTPAGEEPGAAVYDSIVQAQADAQPFVYPDGLVEVPMSPISDIGAFRTGRWRLEWFLKAVELGVAWAIEHRAVFDFLGHPSCLYVTDPEFRAIDLICDLVRKAGRKRQSWAWTPWRNGPGCARARLVRGCEGSAPRVRRANRVGVRFTRKNQQFSNCLLAVYDFGRTIQVGLGAGDVLMGFTDARRKAIDSLRSGLFRCEDDQVADGRNLLGALVVTPEEVVELLQRCRGSQHECVPTIGTGKLSSTSSNQSKMRNNGTSKSTF